MPAKSPFGELIESRNVLLPTLLSVIFVTSLFLIAAAGQNRLATSNSGIVAAEYRAASLLAFMNHMLDAETAARGFVITGDRAYLEPLENARPALVATMTELQQAYAGTEMGDRELPTLQTLYQTNLGLLEQVVDRRAEGYEQAALLVRANVGKRTMDQLRELVSTITTEEHSKLNEARNRARTDQVQGQWLLGLGALLNVSLVVLAGVLVSRDLQRRGQLATLMEDQRQLLEQKVKERTLELAALSTHLQKVSEQERSLLARELHDELGSLLVAARMDLSWLQRRLPTDDPAIKLRWDRIQDGLDSGVNLKRRVVEQLRPTLLDNMGLYTALRWQLQESCGRAGLKCKEQYPSVEPELTEAASIALFRVVQEATTNVLKHAKASSLELELTIDEKTRELAIRIADDGVGFGDQNVAGKIGSHGMASMRHRVASLGGTLELKPGERGGTVLVAKVPLDNALASLPVPVQ